MAKKEVRTKYIKSLMADKEKLENQLNETTKESLDALLDEKVNRTLRQIISESDDTYDVEEVNADEESIEKNPEESEDFEKSEGNDEGNIEGEDNETDNETDIETVDDDTDDEKVWDDVEDCKDDDGEYDLRGKDINTVIKLIQTMDPDDDVRIVKNDACTATVEPSDGDEFVIDIECDNEPEADSFEDSVPDSGNEDMIDDVNIEDDGSDVDFEIEIGDDDYDYYDDEKLTEGNVNLGYTDNYQRKSAMTMPSDKGDGEGDSRFDAGAPKSGDNNKKRWVGHKGQNGGNPYTIKTRQPMSENVDECGPNECGNIYEIELGNEEADEMVDERKFHNGTQPAGSINGNRSINKRRTTQKPAGDGESETVNESRELMAIRRKANSIFQENKDLKKLAEQIKSKLQEATIINNNLAKVVRLVMENSTTKSEKIDILKRFDKVKTLNEGRNLYEQISGELKNAHAVNSTSRLNSALNESKAVNKNLIVETNMLNESEDLNELKEFNRRLMNIPRK